MNKFLEKYGYKLHDGRYGFIAALLGTAMLNWAYRENRRLYTQALANLGSRARRAL